MGGDSAKPTRNGWWWYNRICWAAIVVFAIWGGVSFAIDGESAPAGFFFAGLIGLFVWILTLVGWYVLVFVRLLIAFVFGLTVSAAIQLDEAAGTGPTYGLDKK